MVDKNSKGKLIQTTVFFAIFGALILSVFAASLSTPAYAAPVGTVDNTTSAVPSETPQSFDNPVLDNANILSTEQEEDLKNKLHKLDETTGYIYAVQTIQSTKGQNIAEYTKNKANELGVGEKAKNNGVFTVLAIADRKIYTVTGDGIKISSNEISEKLNSNVVPYLRQKKYADALYQASVNISEIVKNANTNSTNSTDPLIGLITFITDNGKVFLISFVSVFGGIILLGIVLFVIKILVERKKEKAKAKAKKEEQEKREAERKTQSLIKTELSTKLSMSKYNKLDGKKARTAAILDVIKGLNLPADKQDLYAKSYEQQLTQKQLKKKLPTKLITTNNEVVDNQLQKIVYNLNKKVKAFSIDNFVEQNKGVISSERKRLLAEAEKAKQQTDKFMSKMSKDDIEKFVRLNSSGRKDYIRRNFTGDSGVLESYLPFMLMYMITSNQVALAQSAFYEEIAKRAEEERAAQANYHHTSYYDTSSSSFSSFGGGGFDGGSGGGASW